MNDEITRYALIGVDAEMAKLGELRRKLAEPPAGDVATVHAFMGAWEARAAASAGKPDPIKRNNLNKATKPKRKFSAAGIAAIRAGQLRRRKAEKRKGKGK